MSSTVAEKTFHQKLYPTVNNEDLLEFRIPPNIQGNMCLSNVVLRFQIKIPQLSDAEVIPENLLGAKQFSSVEIRINGQAVSRRSCANEYFYSAYFQYMTNFATDYASSTCGPMGIFDDAQGSTEEFKSNSSTFQSCRDGRKGINDDFTYEIVMPIESSIFSSNQNLPTNTSIDLSFERCGARFSTVLQKESSKMSELKDFLSIEDPYLLIPYIVDLEMQHMEKQAVSRPIKLTYDEYVINRYNISRDSPNVRLGNIIAGPLPDKLFWGVTTLETYNGSFSHESPRFTRHGLKKTTLYLDGNVLSGFPVSCANNAVAIPYTRFMTNTNRFMNCYSSRTITQRDFLNFHFIQCADLDSFPSGSLTFDLDFEASPSEELVLITCCVYDRTIEIDNFRNFKVI